MIEGIQHFESLEELSLRNNEITDIGVLENLTNLERLGFSHNEADDTTPLAENEELGDGDEIFMRDNNLDVTE